MSTHKVEYRIKWCDRCGLKLDTTGRMITIDHQMRMHERLLCNVCTDDIFNQCSKFFDDPPSWTHDDIAEFLKASLELSSG